MRGLEAPLSVATRTGPMALHLLSQNGFNRMVAITDHTYIIWACFHCQHWWPLWVANTVLPSLTSEYTNKISGYTNPASLLTRNHMSLTNCSVKPASSIVAILLSTVDSDWFGRIRFVLLWSSGISATHIQEKILPYSWLFTQGATFADAFILPWAGYFHGCIVRDMAFLC